MALRINAGGSVAAPLRLLALPTDVEDYLGRLGLGGGLLTEPETGRGRRGLLDADAASHVRETYTRLGSVDDTSSMGLALRRLAASSVRRSDEDRLIDAWIAFESLFAPDHTSELRFRASLRIARFVGSNRSERTDLFNELKRSYDWRSRIVHGAGAPTGRRAKELGSLRDAVELTDEVLRRALRRGLEGAPNLEEIDRGLLE
jgi:hypothetical protein